MDKECTEYPERRGENPVASKMGCLDHGVIQEFEDGTTLCYESLGKGEGYFVLRASDGDALKMWLATHVKVGG